MKKFLTLKMLALGALVIVVLGVAGSRLFAAQSNNKEEENTEQKLVVVPLNVPVETAVDSNASTLGASTISWPGEILSTADVQIYPAREGQIAEWRVRLGSVVRQGQVLGRLTAGPVSPELVALLADRQKAITQARANVEATATYIQTSKQNLQELKLSLDRARDAAVQAAENNLETLVGSNQEVAVSSTPPASSTQGILANKRDKVRAQARKIQNYYINALSVNSVIAQSDQLYGTYILGQNIGARSSNSIGEFDNAVGALGNDLKNVSAIPETSVFNFLKATQQLLLSTLATDSGYGLSTSKLEDLKNNIGTDQTEFLDVLNEYKEAKAVVENAKGVKNTTVADAGAVYAEKKAELDQKIAELDRELALARSEVRATESAYGSIASGIAGQNIIAPKSGVVSVVFKNVGDQVSPDSPLAGISSAQATGRFVRFRIPSDMRAPITGQEIKIERPGFPLEGKKGKIVGVGLALDSNGAYMADADFLEKIDWPVHASVRVISEMTTKSILVPFTAIWWNEKGEANVWLVMENNIIRPRIVRVGRAVGDRVEIEDGLEAGERYVVKTVPTLKTGQSITELTTVKTETDEPAGDGHGHSHDE